MFVSGKMLGTLVIAGTLVGGVACSQESDRPVEVNRPDVRNDVEDAADDARDAAARAGDRAEGAIERAGDSAAGAIETADIKMALAADDLVEANDINVDTNATTKVVTLKGTVRSAAQRDRAEAIAKREAEGYRVDNQLVVRAS